MAFGIDIYRYQTVTNWTTVKNTAGVKWVYVKPTDGNGPAVVRGDSQVKGAKSVGLPVGGYHYAQFGDPVAQANVFLGEVRRLGAAGLPPALDLESPFSANATAKDFGIRFCRRIAEAGYRPAVYMNSSMASSLRPDQWGIPNLVIWIADYGVNNGVRNPDLRPYTGRADIHQYTSVGRVAGITGSVDLNESLTDITTVGDEDVSWTDKLNDPTNPANAPLAGEWLTWGNLHAAAAKAAAEATSAKVDALAAKVDALQVGAVDVAKLAALLAPTVATLVNDELARRLAE